MQQKQRAAALQHSHNYVIDSAHTFYVYDIIDYEALHKERDREA